MLAENGNGDTDSVSETSESNAADPRDGRNRRDRLLHRRPAPGRPGDDGVAAVNGNPGPFGVGAEGRGGAGRQVRGQTCAGRRKRDGRTANDRHQARDEPFPERTGHTFPRTAASVRPSSRIAEEEMRANPSICSLVVNNLTARLVCDGAPEWRLNPKEKARQSRAFPNPRRTILLDRLGSLEHGLVGAVHGLRERRLEANPPPGSTHAAPMP